MQLDVFAPKLYSAKALRVKHRIVTTLLFISLSLGWKGFYILNYIGCIKEGSRKNYATYEIKEYAFAIFE